METCQANIFRTASYTVVSEYFNVMLTQEFQYFTIS